MCARAGLVRLRYVVCSQLEACVVSYRHWLRGLKGAYDGAAQVSSFCDIVMHVATTNDILNATLRRTVADAALSVACCAGAGCNSGAPRIRWWKGALGSQLNTMLTVVIHAMINGTAVRAHRMSIVPFEQDRAKPQQYVDGKRCRVHPSGAAHCLFAPIESLCGANFTTAAEQMRAGALLREANPYLVASEAARLLLTPNAWLSKRVQLLAKEVGQTPGLAVHVRRGDKLTARGSEAIALPPTSAIARRVASLIATHNLQTILVMSDDADVPDDLAVELTRTHHADVRVIALEIPRMENATFKSGRHVAITTTASARTSRGGQSECGLPATGGRPALPRCATGAAGEPRARIIDLPALMEAHDMRTTPADLAALLHAAAWVMASARVVMASTSSNLGALLFTLAGSQSFDAWGATAVLVDSEDSPHAKRLAMADLAEGRYFCRHDWGMRRFGLCTAGKQGRPLKTW